MDMGFFNKVVLMQGVKLSVVRIVVVGAAALLAAACSTTPDDKASNWSPARIYAEAKEELSAGAYDKAATLFERLEGQAAGTPLAQQAQLEKAYANFKAGESAQALATIERFVKLHPASPAVDYALYLKGVVNFNDDLGWFSFITRQDIAERDQKAAKESFEAFKELLARFPDSRYAADARLRMAYIVNLLAESEVHVARYYYRRGAYLAAINRAQSALADYREVPALEEALYIVAKSYEALGLLPLRDDALRVLTSNYPNSVFVSQGVRTAASPWWKLW